MISHSLSGFDRLLVFFIFLYRSLFVGFIATTDVELFHRASPIYDLFLRRLLSVLVRQIPNLLFLGWIFNSCNLTTIFRSVNPSSATQLNMS